MGEPVEERFPGLEPISFELKHNQPPEGVERYQSRDSYLLTSNYQRWWRVMKQRPRKCYAKEFFFGEF